MNQSLRPRGLDKRVIIGHENRQAPVAIGAQSNVLKPQVVPAATGLGLGGVRRKAPLADISNQIAAPLVPDGVKKKAVPAPVDIIVIDADMPDAAVHAPVLRSHHALIEPVVPMAMASPDVQIMDVDMRPRDLVMPAPTQHETRRSQVAAVAALAYVAPITAPAYSLATQGKVVPSSSSANVASSSTALSMQPPAGNPADLFLYNLAIEGVRSPSPRYMLKQTDITPKMRTILVNWLVEVHRKFRNKQETMFLAVNLLDRFLEKKAVSRSKLQLVGVGALLLACKYEEIYAPEVNELVEMTDNAYTREEVLQVECIILNTLQFELSVPTPHYFAQRALQVCEPNEELMHLTNFLMELCLIDYRMLEWLPSVLASGAVYLARRMMGFPIWNQNLQQTTCYGEVFLRPCVMDIQNVLLNPDPKEEAVRKKYASSKYKCVARIPPCSL